MYQKIPAGLPLINVFYSKSKSIPCFTAMLFFCSWICK